MRCLLCGKLSWRYLCKPCDASLRPAPKRHLIEGKLNVISFYPYDDVSELIKTKYHPFGTRILRHLSRKAFKPFFDDLSLEVPVALLPVDDRPGRWFSHTAALARAAESRSLSTRYGRLHARANVHYAGQTLAFRKANPRKFALRAFEEEAVILMDDLMTTGTTLAEAAETIEKTGKGVLFAVVLAAAD